jgi:hypothetical protein
MTDCRDRLRDFDIPTLLLQCSNDVIAPAEVGEYVVINPRAAMPSSSGQLGESCTDRRQDPYTAALLPWPTKIASLPSRQ